MKSHAKDDKIPYPVGEPVIDDLLQIAMPASNNDTHSATSRWPASMSEEPTSLMTRGEVKEMVQKKKNA